MKSRETSNANLRTWVQLGYHFCGLVVLDRHSPDLHTHPPGKCQGHQSISKGLEGRKPFGFQRVRNPSVLGQLEILTEASIGKFSFNPPGRLCRLPPGCTHFPSFLFSLIIDRPNLCAGHYT